MLQRRTISLADGPVNLLDWGGSGPALHFTHANGFNAETYVPIIGALSDTLHVLASDLRGHGQTGLPADPAAHDTWLVYRDDLIRVLEAIGAGPYVLSGHSMGGTTSLLVAAARPDLVRALVLFEPVAFDPPPGYDRETSPYILGARKRRAAFDSAADARRAYTGRGAFRTWPEETLDAYLRGGLKPDGEGGEGVRLSCDPRWEAANFMLGSPPLGEAIGRIVCPLTILHGTEQSTTGQPFLDRVRAALPQARIELVQGASHFLPMEQPVLVRRTILSAFNPR
jgi:pimeloyl-ACP methyl ester carboxylesterase